MKTWTDPIPLQEYSQAASSPGLYVIGQPIDSMVPPSRSGLTDPYLLDNWPNNFKPEYVGISEANSPGVKGRLSCHSRSKGCRHVATLLKAGVGLYFIVLYGLEETEYEALFIAMKTRGQFEGNKRDENDRLAKKQFNRNRNQMGEAERQFYDHLDVDGDGM